MARALAGHFWQYGVNCLLNIRQKMHPVRLSSEPGVLKRRFDIVQVSTLTNADSRFRADYYFCQRHIDY